jgi:hypothetical protein
MNRKQYIQAEILEEDSDMTLKIDLIEFFNHLNEESQITFFKNILSNNDIANVFYNVANCDSWWWSNDSDKVNKFQARLLENFEEINKNIVDATSHQITEAIRGFLYNLTCILKIIYEGYEVQYHMSYNLIDNFKIYFVIEKGEDSKILILYDSKDKYRNDINDIFANWGTYVKKIQEEKDQLRIDYKWLSQRLQDINDENIELKAKLYELTKDEIYNNENNF